MTWTICGVMWLVGLVVGIAVMRAAAKPMPFPGDVGTKSDHEEGSSSRQLVSTVFDHQTAND